MKQILFLLLMAATCTARAQYGGDENSNGRIRAGVAYVHDFPGLNGGGAYVEYSFPLNEWIQGGVGIRHIEAGGYPRTQTVREYTKATALDFNLLFVPFHTAHAAFRIGAGYSFSFYNIRRSYPVYAAHADSSTVTGISWPQTDAKGSTRGISLVCEYEYYFSNNFSAGAKIALCKAYGSVIMAGPFVAVKF
jgi:predicted porin